MPNMSALLSGWDSQLTKPSPTVTTQEGMSQHATGKTNASSSSSSATGMANVYGGGILVLVALLTLWLGGGIVLKGL